MSRAPSRTTTVRPSRSIPTTERASVALERGEPSGSKPLKFRREAIFWIALAMVSVAIFASWLPSIDLALGDSHEGRILARQALQVRNFFDLGPFGSGLATLVDPYPLPPYAHHPPLVNAIQVATVAALGEGAWQMRMLGYLTGALTPLLWASILRGAGVGRMATLLAVIVSVATPMFWIYERLGLGYFLVLALTALGVRVERVPSLAAPMAVVACAASLGSWPGLVASGLWLAVFAVRKQWRLVRALAAGTSAALLLTAAWVANATDAAELLGHLAQRTVEAGIGLADVVGRQAFFLGELLPWPYLVLAPLALGAGLWDRRTRTVVGVLGTVNLLWAFSLPEGAFVHDFWNLGALATITVGLGALFEVRLTNAPLRSTLVWIVALTIVFFGLWDLRSLDAQVRYFEQPAEAGRLLEQTPPPASQKTLWVVPAVAAPRWASFTWDMPVALVVAPDLGEAPDSDLILLRLDRVEPWMPVDLADPVTLVAGRYGLVDAATLRALAGGS